MANYRPHVTKFAELFSTELVQRPISISVNKMRQVIGTDVLAEYFSLRRSNVNLLYILHEGKNVRRLKA
jgi:hypothetical protein